MNPTEIVQFVNRLSFRIFSSVRQSSHLQQRCWQEGRGTLLGSGPRDQA